MLPRILLLLICLPLIEILILIKLGEVFGLWATVTFVLGMGFLGGILARFEGIRAWTNFHRALNAGEMPAEHMIDAFCGLLVLLSAQFETQDFSPGNSFLALHGPDDGMKSGIGEYFRVRFPTNWPSDLRYNFNWQKLENELDPFQTIDYSKIT